MKKTSQYENQKVLVLGLAKSGVSAAKLLHSLGAFVTVNDYKPLSENPEAQNLLKLGIRVVTGGHPIELLDEDFALLVKNPGIPYSNPLIKQAQIKKIPIITEVELAYQITDAPIIGITGTNGKTTTTTMIALLLNQNRSAGKARLAGNIGLPASTVACETTKNDDLVMELSSFQLLGIEEFHPHIAIITNLYEAHIDYHGTREAYVEAKWQLQKNMTKDDFLILNWDQEELRQLATKSQASIIPFSTLTEQFNGAYLRDGEICFKQETIMPASELGVPGKHNLENALAAIAAAKLKNVDNEAIRQAMQQFTGVPHRTQFIDTWEGRHFYNDSKATNMLATEKAISGFQAEKLILLAGGLDRGNPFDDLIPSLNGLKAIVLFGETKEKLASAAKIAGIEQIIFAENVEQAVPAAYELSSSEDTILLSPACASWDQYPNFEVRGTRFVEAIQRLKEGAK